MATFIEEDGSSKLLLHSYHAEEKDQVVSRSESSIIATGPTEQMLLSHISSTSKTKANYAHVAMTLKCVIWSLWANIL